MITIGPEAQAPRAPVLQRQELGAALGRALTHLAALQRADGSWEVDVEEGPPLLSAYLVVKRRFGVLGEREACAGAKTLLAAQRTDGSFAPYPGADGGTLMATALAAAALEATRVPKARAAIARADRYVDLAGGEAAIMKRFHEHLDLSVVFLVAAKRLSATLLPEMPLEILTTPFERLVDRRAHPGNVLGMLVLLALSDRAATRSATREALRARIEALVAPHVTEAGGFFGWPWHTLTCLVGLEAAGAKPSDELVARALAWLAQHERYDDGALRLAALGNDVLSTAHAVSALTEAADTSDAGPRGVAFLLAAQSTVPMPRPNQRKTEAPRVGGWSAQRDDALFPDTDTSAAVLSALARRPRRREARGALDPVIERGAAWLAGMQNPNGGFPTYVWDLSEKARGPLESRGALGLERPLGVIHLLFDPPPELGDPATEGVTGRVLGALGRAGITRKDPVASRAIAFLHQQQCDHGGFWGRSMTCYLAETATVLDGLAAIGEDTRLPYAERATEFLLAHQNPDGGWGELPSAYRDPSLAGVGPSMPAVTAHVLLGLLAISDPPYEAIQAGIQWLLTNQRADGSWSNEGFLHARLLPDHFYTYALPALTVPIVALSRYRDRLERQGRLVSSARRKRRLGMLARVLHRSAD